MRRIVSLGCVGFVGLFMVGCSADTKNDQGAENAPNRQYPPDSTGEEQAKPGDTSPGTAPGAGTACGFAPANGIGCESGPVADVGAECDALEIDTTSGKFACGIAAPSKLIDQGPGSPKIRVFYVNGLRVGRDSKVHVTGTNALAIVSRGDVVIEGILDLSAENRECDAGPGGYRGGAGANGKGENGFGAGSLVGGLRRDRYPRPRRVMSGLI